MDRNKLACWHLRGGRRKQILAIRDAAATLREARDMLAPR